MPTYFGPTNLPPLEAWAFGKPLVYSRLFADQVRNAAILIDPDNVQELASAMKKCTEALTRAELVANGKKRLEEIQVNREDAEQQLLARLLQFERRLRCWH